MTSYNEWQQCQQVWWNTLKASRTHHSAGFIIREVWDTKECDHISDLSHLRGAYHNRLGTKRLERVLAYEQDDLQTRQTAFHYKSWTEHTLWSELSTLRKLAYLFARPYWSMQLTPQIR